MNDDFKTKRSLLSRVTLFSKNHPVLVFLALSGCFLLVPGHFAHATSIWELLTSPSTWIKGLLYGIYWFFSLFVLLAAKIFIFVVDTKNFSDLMNHASIYVVWLTVRDFCNIFFILVLLFSAFATIFQLEKYEWKKTIPLLIIMALLVNFSFPISRFIIDLANVPMYFFAQNVLTSQTGGVNKILQEVLSASEIRNIILPGSNESDVGNYDFSYYISAIICMFLFGISFLVLSVLMLIRMIALAILVMFSPIGFVGLITPALHKFAHDWWDKLFKWAFYGPIAMLLLLVAVVVMKAAAVVYEKKNATMGQLTGNSVDENFLASIAFLTIPIVLFWIAITQAEKYSNDMSGLGIKFGSNMGRKVGGWLRKGAWGAAMYIPKQTGVAGGIKQAWQDRMSGFKDSREKRERAVAGVFGGDRARARVDQENKKLTDEMAKKMDMGNLGDKKLRAIIENKNGNKYEKAAALTELAERGTADRKDLANIRNIFGKDSQVTRGFEAKMRAFDPVAVFTEKIDPLTGTLTGPVNADGLENFVKSNRFDPKKLLSGSLTPELLQYAFKAKNISMKDLDELRSKGGDYVKAIEKSLDESIKNIGKDNGGKWDMTDEIQRNIQSAYLAQTGRFHESMDKATTVFEETDDTTGAKTTVSARDAKGAIIARSDANTLKRVKSGFVGTTGAGFDNLNVLIDRLAAGKYTDVILEMEKSGTEQAEVAKAINDALRGFTGATGNAKRLQDIALKDHRLSHLR